MTNTVNATETGFIRTRGKVLRRRFGGGDDGGSRRLRGGWGYTLIAIGLMMMFLFPVYWMVNVSLQPAGSAVGTPWVPIDISFDGYATAIADQGRPLMVSLVVALSSVLLCLILAAPASFALARYKIPGVRLVLLGLLISQMIPGIVVANALYSAYTDLGLLNSIPGLVLADTALGVPFSMLILHTYMRSIPPAIVEASWIDGAGPIRSFFSVVLPMSRNAIVTAALFTFLFAWGDFLFALTLTTTEEVRPVTLSLYTYIGAYVADWSSVMATAVLASLPAIVLLVIAQRYVAAGVSTGAVK